MTFVIRTFPSAAFRRSFPSHCQLPRFDSISPTELSKYSFPYINMLPRAPRAILSAIRPSHRISRIAAPAVVHPQIPQQPQPALRQSFHSSPIAPKGIHPESSDPPAPKPQSHNVAGAAVHITEPTPLTDAKYYEYSEHYLESLLNEVERTAQEDASDLEGEYNVRQAPSMSVEGLTC